MTKKVLGFFNEFEFLSNFVPARVKLDDVEYPTVEHAYQAAKTTDQKQRGLVKLAVTPGQAKRLGRRVTIRDDWESVKEDVMLDLLRQKFQYPQYKKDLLETGDAYLEETNYWNDEYWGVCNGKGKNRLGTLLMKVREELL